MTPHTTATHTLQPSSTWLCLKRMTRRKHKWGRDNIDTLKLPVPWVYILSLWKCAFPCDSSLSTSCPKDRKLTLENSNSQPNVAWSSQKNQLNSHKMHIHGFLCLPKVPKRPGQTFSYLYLHISIATALCHDEEHWCQCHSETIPVFVKNLYANTVGP